MSAASTLTCVHAARCPGCPLLALPYPEQLARKQEHLRQALAAYPALSHVPVAATRPAAPVTGYRLRAKLVVAGRALGLFAEGSHEVVDTPQCVVLAPSVARVVAIVRAALPLELELLAIDVRAADDGVLLTLIAPRGSDVGAARRAAAALMAKSSEILGVALAERAPRSAQVLGSAPTPLCGAGFARQRFAANAPWHRAVPGGFVQSHGGQTAALHAAIEAALAANLSGLAGRRILELYAGEGALALRLAARGADVTVADSFAPNLAQLEHSARSQGLRVTTLAASAEQALARVAVPDALLVDPPRRGLSPAVRGALGRLAPGVLLYVSCEPATLARDLSHLRELGFAVEATTPWDMIPLSESVETLALLKRGAAPPARVLYEDAALIAVDKPPHLPTTPQGEHSRSLLDAVRALPDAAEAVPIHRLDVGTSGVCLFARRPEHVQALAAALARGEKTYVLAARGVVHKKGRCERPIPDAGALRAAATSYRREAVVGTHSLVRACPQQGRRHQIRRHFAGIGHPLLGDARYGDPASNRFFEQRHGLDRTFLHCAEISLARGAESLSLRSPLAPDLEAVLTSLRAASRAEKTPALSE